MGDDIQLDVYMAVFITWPVATFVLFLRFWARRITGIHLSWDDWFLIVAYFFAMSFNVATIVWIQSGLGRHIGDINGVPSVILRTSAIHLFVAELTYATSLACVKFSILSFYWRVFKVSPIRIPIIVLFAMSAIWLIIRTFMSIFHCVPVHALWDGVDNVPGAVCNIDGSKFFVASTSAHLGLDILIIALPVFQIGQLQLRRAQRWGISVLFTFGVLVCVASICLVVNAVSFNPSTTDLTYDITRIIIWAAVEVNLAVISACLPLLRPIFTRILSTLNISSLNKSSGAGATGDYQHSRPRTFIRLGGFATKSGGGGGTMNADRDHVGRSKVSDEADSTYELAKIPKMTRSDATMGMNSAHDANSGRTLVTVTGTAAAEDTIDWDVQPEGNGGGIIVKKETSIVVT